jgi:hypothetical protein
MRIAERCLVTPEKWNGPKPWKANYDKWPLTCLMIHTTCQDTRGEPLQIGVGVVHTPLRDTVRVFYAQGYEKEARVLADAHHARALPVEDFSRRFVNYYAKKGGVVAGWLPGVDLSRMAVGWSDVDADHFTLYLASRPPTKNERHPLLANGEVPDTTVLPVRVKPLDGQRAILSFASDYWGVRPGPLLDLRPFAEQLHGQDFGENDPAEVCSLFDVAYRSEGDLVERTLALTDLYDALLDVHLSFGLPILPSGVYSPGSYPKALLASRGIDRAPEISRADADHAMRALYGGEGFPYVYRYPVPVASLDFGGCHQVVAALSGAWRMHQPEKIVTEEMTGEEATGEIERVVAMYREWRSFDGPPPTKEDRHFLLASVFDIDPHGDVLPHHPSGKKDDVMRVAPVIASSEPLARSGYDLVRSILQMGKTPNILGASRYVAEGSRAPGSPDPFLELWSLRQRLEADAASVPANERERRDGWAKGVANPLASGIPIQVQDRPARKRERVLIGDDDKAIPAETVEEPGPLYNPIIAVGVNANARLIQYLAASMVEERGGTVVRTNIDALDVLACREEGRTVFVPGLGMRKALSYREVDEIRWKIDELLGELTSDLPPGPHRVMTTVVHAELPEQLEASWATACTEFPERLEVPLADVFESCLPVSVPEPRFLKLEPECEPRASAFRLSDPYLYAIASNSHSTFRIRYRAPHVEIRKDESGIPHGVVVGVYVPDGIDIADYTRHGLVQYVERDGYEREVWENILTGLPWDDIIRPNAIESKPLSFAEEPHLTLMRATRMRDVRAIPGMRPMARMFSATPWAPGGNGRHPVAACHESFDPFSADWYDWTTGDPLTLVPIDEWDGYVDRPDVPVDDMRSFVSRFGQYVPKRAVTADGEPCTRKTVGAIYPASIIVTGIDRVGKQGPKIADQGTEGILPTQGTTTYRDAHRIEDVLTFLRRYAGMVGASALIREAAEDDITERTVKRALYSTNGYRPQKDTATAFARLAERLAESDGLNIEESILLEPTPRVCQECGELLTKREQKWCSNSCKQRAKRAKENPR